MTMPFRVRSRGGGDKRNQSVARMGDCTSKRRSMSAQDRFRSWYKFALGIKPPAYGVFRRGANINREIEFRVELVVSGVSACETD